LVARKLAFPISNAHISTPSFHVAFTYQIKRFVDFIGVTTGNVARRDTALAVCRMDHGEGDESRLPEMGRFLQQPHQEWIIHKPTLEKCELFNLTLLAFSIGLCGSG